MKNFILTVFTLFIASFAMAQLNQTDLSVEMSTSKLWRGIDRTSSPAVAFDFTVQPTESVEIGLYNDLPLIGTWGYIRATTQLYANYTITDEFSAGVRDYYFYNTPDYANFDDHIQELFVEYDGMYNGIGGFVGYNIQDEAFYIEASITRWNATIGAGYTSDQTELNFNDEAEITSVFAEYEYIPNERWEFVLQGQFRPSAGDLDFTMPTPTPLPDQNALSFALNVRYNIF